jgi:hypothetical protein
MENLLCSAFLLIGKASDLDRLLPEYINHLYPELNPCYFVMYVKCYQTWLEAVSVLGFLLCLFGLLLDQW